MKGLYTLVFFCFISDTTDGYGESLSPFYNVQPEQPVNGIRIAWDHSTLKQLSPVGAAYSGYARMIKLHDGSLFCVYESDGATHAIKSSDGGKLWTKPMIIASPENNIACAVPEVLQLHDRSLLVSYNLRPPADNTDPEKRFSIQVKRSVDEGAHWSDAVEVYKAGFEFKNGCWEPAQIQLPSGEVQLYIANEGPYTQSDEQEITMFRSTDLGVTWSAGERVSFRKGYRDGMPVPLILKNKKEIIVAIEDNGIDPKEFKPAIIRTSATNSWSNAPVLSSDDAREYAMDKSVRIPKTKYAGAPYIRQLSSGDVILSYQGNELRKDFRWDRSDMIVSIGSPDGRNFTRKSTPFFISDSSKTALWSSLCVENDSTIIALTSTNAYGKTAVWMIKGHVLREIKSRRSLIRVDSEKTESLWKTQAPVFIGGYGTTQTKINTAWDNDNFFITADVQDNKVFATTADPRKDDAIQFFLDPKNRSLTLPGTDIFSLLVTAGGKVLYKQGKDGSWVDWTPSDIVVKANQTEHGYLIEIAIPWLALNHIPEKNERIGFHANIMETSTGNGYTYIEPLSGNVTNASFTWSPIFLIDQDAK